MVWIINQERIMARILSGTASICCQFGSGSTNSNNTITRLVKDEMSMRKATTGMLPSLTFAIYLISMMLLEKIIIQEMTRYVSEKTHQAQMLKIR
jgi:hypothetical protein